VLDVARVAQPLIEFPADDPVRARRFWAELLGTDLRLREASEGEGWETRSGDFRLGVHQRGRGPGDSFSLPYFAVTDIAQALEQVRALGGTVVHPGDRWAICKDSEGSPFGLSQDVDADRSA
jgi:predicted enzyme related to lactoylglutathione lyase